MGGHFFLAFVVYAIVATIPLITEAGVQSTEDDSASCDEAVKLMREELKDMKKRLESNQQQCSQTNEALNLIRKELEDVKQQLSQTESSGVISYIFTSEYTIYVCKYFRSIRHGLCSVKLIKPQNCRRNG